MSVLITWPSAGTSERLEEYEKRAGHTALPSTTRREARGDASRGDGKWLRGVVRPGGYQVHFSPWCDVSWTGADGGRCPVRGR